MITWAYVSLVKHLTKDGDEIENAYNGIFIFGCMDLLALAIVMATIATLAG